MSVRTISAELQEHLDSGMTTVCLLMKITPQAPGYDVVGITSLDRDVIYDDGDGDITYHCAVGMIPSEMVSTAAMDVGNGQITHLVDQYAQYNLGFTEDDIARGAYDYANFTLMLVNYEDLTMGHMLFPPEVGQLGQMTVESGLSVIGETADLSKKLKQTVVEKDSITCRAIFGSQPLGTPGDSDGSVITQRFPCGKDLSGLWTNGDVTSVGVETSRTFTDSGLGLAANSQVPGMLEWLTGDNAGRFYEVESQSGAGVVSLWLPTMFPIQVGDTFRIRPDCTKWVEGTNGCKFHFGVPEWKNHYRGEPYIPISDADSINTPGATVGTGDA